VAAYEWENDRQKAGAHKNNLPRFWETNLGIFQCGMGEAHTTIEKRGDNAIFSFAGQQIFARRMGIA
jgi:hypothetical protein